MEYCKASMLEPEILRLLKCYGGKELVLTEGDFSQLSVLWYTPKTDPSYTTKTIKNPNHCIAFGMPVFTILVVKGAFEELNEEAKRAALFHALMRISFDDNGGYRLVNPDINDFSSLITRIGLFYERAGEMFSDDVLVSAEKSSLTA